MTVNRYKRGSLLRHKELHDETIYKCYNCVSQFINQAYLSMHEQSVHGGVILTNIKQIRETQSGFIKSCLMRAKVLNVTFEICSLVRNLVFQSTIYQCMKGSNILAVGVTIKQVLKTIQMHMGSRFMKV